MPRTKRPYVKITTVQVEAKDHSVIKRAAKEYGLNMPRVLAAMAEAWKNCSQTVRDQAILFALNRNVPSPAQPATETPATNEQVAA